VDLPTGQDILYWGLVAIGLVVVLVLGVWAIIPRLRKLGGVKIGDVEIRGEAGLDVRKLITAVVELEMRKHSLHHEWVDRCRDKIRISAKGSIQRLKNHTKLFIQEWYIGKGTPKVKSDEWRDYASIAELMYYKMVETGMNSVEQNRYAERSEIEFLALTNDVFARVVEALDALLYEMWDEDNEITASDLIESTKPLLGDFRDQVRAVLLECRHLAIRKCEDEKRIQRDVDQIVDGGSDTIENAMGKEL